jgi:hypothetical protein
MRGLRARLERLERRLRPKMEVLVLYDPPGGGGITYDEKTFFGSVEAAVESFKRERGVEALSHVLVMHPPPEGPPFLEDD